jgi:hypothetical protein
MGISNMIKEELKEISLKSLLINYLKGRKKGMKKILEMGREITQKYVNDTKHQYKILEIMINHVRIVSVVGL